jgi:hypothetical protein
MIEQILLQYFWVGTLLAAVLYTTDHILSVWEIALYNRGGKDLIQIEGYDRLVAKYLKPDGSIRWLHSRLIGILAVILVGLPSAWWALTGRMDLPQVFLLLLGGICLSACMDIITELRMTAILRYGMKGELDGELKVTRGMMMTLSYITLYGFALLFLILFLVTGDWFVLGGLLVCFLKAQSQWHVALIKR